MTRPLKPWPPPPEELARLRREIWEDLRKTFRDARRDKLTEISEVLSRDAERLRRDAENLTRPPRRRPPAEPPDLPCAPETQCENPSTCPCPKGRRYRYERWCRRWLPFWRWLERIG